MKAAQAQEIQGYIARDRGTEVREAHSRNGCCHRRTTLHRDGQALHAVGILRIEVLAIGVKATIKNHRATINTDGRGY